MNKFINEVATSIYLDKSRKTKTGKYKVRLYINDITQKKRKYYSTKFEFTEDEFKNIWETVRVKKEFKDERKKLLSLISQSDAVIGKINPFNFEDFELIMFNKESKEKDVNFYFQKKIAFSYKRESISTAEGYSNALKCIHRFHTKPALNFADITNEWLIDFEKYCTNIENKSLSTVGIYLRNLRAVFNDAIEDKTINKDRYPFGKKKYTIPAPTNVKKALTKEQVQTLFKAEPLTPEQQKAKDFWVLSLLCNGMNIKDILSLRCKDYDGEKIIFIRAKTARHTSTPKPITVFVEEESVSIINKYGNPNGKKNDYIFNVLHKDDDAMERQRKKNNFIRFVNQNFKKFANNNGIKDNISTYWARHTFATLLVQNNTSMEEVGEALGHSNMITTQNYFEGFSDENKKRMSRSVLGIVKPK